MLAFSSHCRPGGSGPFHRSRFRHCEGSRGEARTRTFAADGAPSRSTPLLLVPFASGTCQDRHRASNGCAASARNPIGVCRTFIRRGDPGGPWSGRESGCGPSCRRRCCPATRCMLRRPCRSPGSPVAPTTRIVAATRDRTASARPLPVQSLGVHPADNHVAALLPVSRVASSAAAWTSVGNIRTFTTCFIPRTVTATPTSHLRHQQHHRRIQRHRYRYRYRYRYRAARAQQSDRTDSTSALLVSDLA